MYFFDSTLYNTSRPKINLRGNGRYVQSFIEQIKEIDNIEERTTAAHMLIPIIKRYAFLSSKNRKETDEQAWNILFAISNYDLEVNSPYPMPTPPPAKAPVPTLHYPGNAHSFGAQGRYLNSFLKQVIALKDAEQQSEALRSFFISAKCLNIKLGNLNSFLLYAQRIQKKPFLLSSEEVSSLFKEHYDNVPNRTTFNKKNQRYKKRFDNRKRPYSKKN